jgi:mycothiol synthase
MTTQNRVLTGLRPYDSSDLERLVALMAASNAWPPAGAPSPRDLTSRWSRWQVVPEQDVNVLPDANGDLIAFSRATLLTEPTTRVSLELAVRPDRRDLGIGSALFDLALQRARRLGAEHVTTPLFLGKDETRPLSVAFLERRGFYADSSYWQMRLDGLALQPPARWPQGTGFRYFGDPATDSERWAALVTRAFGEDTSASRIHSQLAEAGSDRLLYIFAVDLDTGREIGTTRGRVDTLAGEATGYVGTVGVLPEYRGRGLGRALMLQIVQILAARGLTSATLFVEGANDGARRLYQSLGWREVYRTVHYWKSLPAVVGPESLA